MDECLPKGPRGVRLWLINGNRGVAKSKGDESNLKQKTQPSGRFMLEYDYEWLTDKRNHATVAEFKCGQYPKSGHIFGG